MEVSGSQKRVKITPIPPYGRVNQQYIKIVVFAGINMYNNFFRYQQEWIVKSLGMDGHGQLFAAFVVHGLLVVSSIVFLDSENILIHVHSASKFF